MAVQLGVSSEAAEIVLSGALKDLIRAENIDPDSPDPDRWCYSPRYERPESRPGYIHVPFMSKSEDAAPLRRVIASAADRAGTSDFMTISVMTYVWEAIAKEVGAGNVVRVPGWGIYGPYRWNPLNGGEPVVYPRFVAARPFRQEVRELCPPELARNDALRIFQRSHHPGSRPRGSQSLTMTTMEAWRSHIDSQAGGRI